MDEILIGEALDLQSNIKFKNMLLLALAINVLGTMAFINNKYRSIAAVLICACLAVSISKQVFAYMLPPLIIFYEYLVLPGGLSVFRVYSLLFVVLIAYKRSWKYPNFGVRKLIYVFITTFYIVLTVFFYTGDLKKCIFLIVDVVFMATYTHVILEEESKFSWVGYTLIIAILFSCIAGATHNVAEDVGVYVNGRWTYQRRLLGTFIDPNYLSLYINCAIFFTIILDKIPKFVKVAALCGLYFGLLATCSTTGILANVLGAVIYLFIAKKINIKACIALIIFAFMFNRLYLYAVSVDIPYISGFIWRMISKFQEGSDVDALTTERSVLWREHWAFFCNQNPFRIIFGGNNINAVSIDTSLFNHLSHEEYLDLLLTYGILGTGLILIPNVVHTVLVTKEAARTMDETILCITMMKYLYFFYAFGLTMNFDYKFMLFTLI